MPHYICLLFSKDRDVIRIETLLDVHDDPEADGRALATALGSASAVSYELWRGGKKINSVPDKHRHAAMISKQKTSE